MMKPIEVKSFTGVSENSPFATPLADVSKISSVAGTSLLEKHAKPIQILAGKLDDYFLIQS